MNNLPKQQSQMSNPPQATMPVPTHHNEELHPSPSANSQLATPRILRRDSISSQRSRSNSEASLTPVHWLRDQLHKARIECPHRPHCFFIPRSVLAELMTVTTVSKNIQARNPNIDEHHAVSHAERACQYARQLYATLVYMKKDADICLLLDEGITDEDLPFVQKPNARSRFALFRKNGRVIKTLEGWTNKHLENFDRFQWWMIAPVFRPNEELYTLDDKMLLPFVPFEASGDEVVPKQGGYSEVYPVRIHPAHHEFWPPRRGSIDDEPLVAIKKLFSPDETEFLREATVLNSLSLKYHPHLIRLLATYKYDGKYHLMFPYANANLMEYWDDRPTPDFDKATVLWSLQQMTGIADGLLRIHNFHSIYPLLASSGAGGVRISKDMELMVQSGEEWFGRHGDIKPQNVLWFDKSLLTDSPMGVLQIADFGLGRFYGRDSRLEVEPEPLHFPPTYAPPESQLQQPVSRAYDIWSLGCLYLEFITWLLKGSLDIDGFSEFRARENAATGISDDDFFTIITDTNGTRAIVRESVVVWVDELHRHNKCSRLIHDLLHLIMKDLLVTEAKDRVGADWLHQQLYMKLQEAEEDEEYMLKPASLPTSVIDVSAKKAE